MNEQERIDDFLAGEAYAVVGASRDRSKYGNRVLRAYLAAGRRAYPVNPREEEIEGVPSWPDLAAVPGPVHGVSIVTPPAITERVVDAAIARGVKRVWMQPGSESKAAVERAEAAGLSVLAWGPCVLVALSQRGVRLPD